MIVRLVLGLFCWMSSIYALLSASSFTYQQFLRPRVFAWVGWFSDHHAILYWAWLALALASLVPHLRRGGAARLLARACAVVFVAVGVWLTLFPVLPALVDNRWSLFVSLMALLPLVWLAAIDYLVARDYIRRQPSHTSENDGRLLVATIGAGVVVVILYAALTPVWIAGNFEPDLLTTGLLIGFGWSLVAHLLIFGGIFLILALVERATRALRFELRYAVALGLIAVAVAFALQTIVNRAIGLDDRWGYAAAFALSISIVLTAAALRLRRWSRMDAPLGRMTTGFDLVFGPPPADRQHTRALAGLVGVAVAAFVLAAAAGRMDWDFLLLKLTVLCVWVAAFDVIYRATPRDLRVATPALVAVCAFPLAAHAIDKPLQARLPRWLDTPGSTIRHTLDRYAVYNPTFQLADDALRDRAGDTPSFDRFVRANTAVNLPIEPISFDFVPALQPASDPPDIFLFVIDSLRSDYLGAYNPAVRFTPRIDAFAADSLVFRNAFTRYGGTGLSMSSMWMGAVTPHKQYVQPFAPMNALEKLLRANGYQSFVSMDHIMEQLLTKEPSLLALDAGIPELEYDFCRTLGEIQDILRKRNTFRRPAFAHTRSLNLHVAAVKSGTVAPGESYPGFEAAYASRVHRFDACFGRFIDLLKERGLYERSIVILTADHGEMLGEDRQWGHAYYLYPAIVEVPLIVHAPGAARLRKAVDLDVVGLSTDITPTLYALVGYDPQRPISLMGRPLVPATAALAARRRRETEVLAASYGAVWGTLTHNGRRLYIVDANHGREYAYQRPARGSWSAVPVTEAMRAVSRRAIRQEIEQIARIYRMNTVP